MGIKNEYVKAYILLITELGKEHSILEALKSIDNNVELSADLVFGEYDMVVVVKAPTIRYLDKVVTKIRSMDGVISTLTLIAS